MMTFDYLLFVCKILRKKLDMRIWNPIANNIVPGMTNRSAAKTVEQWVLLGDPSLQIGGYAR